MNTNSRSFHSLFNRRFFLTAAGSFATATIFASCTQQVSQVDRVKLPRGVRIAWLKGNIGFFILKAKGDLDRRFKDLGVAVDWFEFPTIPIQLEAMNSGRLDFGPGVDASLVFAQASAVPFVYVSAEPPRPHSLALVVHKDSSIQSVADFRGKKVGYAIGWNLHYLLVKALEKSGLGVNDIQSVKITAAADGMAAFESRSIDVLAIWDPFYALMEKKMQIRTIVDGEGFTANRAYTIATPTFSRDYPDAIKVILEELEKVSVWASKNPQGVAELLAPQLNLDKDILAAASQRRPYGVIPVDEAITLEQQNVADTFHKIGLISKQIQVKELVAHNPRWLPKDVAKA